MDKVILQEAYDEWTTKVEEAIRVVQTKVKKRNTKIMVKKLQRIWQGVRQNLKKTVDERVRKILSERINLMKEHIHNENAKTEANRIKLITQQLRQKNRLQGAKIWEIKRKISKQREQAHWVKNKSGKKVDIMPEIQAAYKEHFQSLLQIREARTTEERDAELSVATRFQEIVAMEEQSDRLTIGTDIVKKAIRKTKSNRAPDRSKWKAEWIKKGGEEMEKSLSKLFNRIEEERQVPRQWDQILIRSLHEKGPKEDPGNKQGIFLTNTISKIYERVKLIQNEHNLNNMSEMQCEAQKNRSPLDHTVTLNAVIENQRGRGERTYVFFGDDENALTSCDLKIA